MLVDRVNRETDDLDTALVELWFDFGHVAEFGGADRREVLRVREQHHPRIANPVVEVDIAFRGLRLEIRRCIIDREESSHTSVTWRIVKLGISHCCYARASAKWPKGS